MGRTQPDTLDASPADGSDYTAIPVPEELARRTRVMVDLDGTPGTLGELAQLFEETGAFTLGDAFTWQDLLVSDGETRHEVRIGDQVHHTYCILDALVLPFVLDRPVEITSQPPVDGDVIRITATPERLTATPASTIVSFGTSLDFPETTDALDEGDPAGLLELTHDEGCPKINAFPDREAYEAWAKQAEAVTLGMTLAQAYAMAHDTAHAL